MNVVQDSLPVSTAVVIDPDGNGAFEKVRVEREAETAHLAAIVESSDDAIIGKTLEGGIVSWNRAAERLYGYAEEEVKGRSISIIFPPERKDELTGIIARLKQGERVDHYDTVRVRKDGKKIDVSVTVSPVRDATGAIAGASTIARDITEQKRAEETLRRATESELEKGKSRTRQDLVVILLLGVVVFAVGRYFDVFDVFTEWALKYRALAVDELIVVLVFFAFAFIVYSYRRSQEAQVQMAARRHSEEALRVLHAELERRVRERTGDVTRANQSLRGEIAERLRSEEALRESEERYKSLFENSNAVMWLVDPEKAEIVDANRAAGAFYGYSREDLRGKKLTNINIYTSEQLAELLKQAKVGDRKQFYVKHRLASGEIRDVEIHSGPIQVQGRALLYSIIHDITDRRIAEGEIERRGEEFATLYDTSRELAAQQDLPALLQTVVNSTRKLLDPTNVVFALSRPGERAVELVAGHNMPLPVGTLIPLGSGMIGQVALSRQPLVVNDYANWDRRLPALEKSNLVSGTAVPMIFGGELIGVLLISQTAPPPLSGIAPRQFLDSEVRLLELFAAQAASAIHNGQLLEETSERAQQLALLYDAGLTLNRTLDPHTQLEFLFQIAKKTVHAELAEFWRYDAARNQVLFEMGLGSGGVSEDGFHNTPISYGEPRGLVGLVAQTRIPIYLGDVAADPRYVPADPRFAPADAKIRSGLWVPVERQNELLGVLTILSMRPQAFTPQDERLLVLFANQAAVAIENARLFSQTEKGLRRLSALNGIDKAITSSLDLQVTLDIFLDNVVRELHVDAAIVLLLDSVTQTLEFAAGRGLRSGASSHNRLKVGEGYAGQAVILRSMISIPDLDSRSIESASPLMRREGMKAYYAAPLICKGQVKGVLEVLHRSPLNPDEEWLSFLETLAGQAAIAVDSIQMFDSLQKSNLELMLAYDTTLEGWSHALDLRDKETEGHTQRVTELTLDLARGMGMSDAELVHVRRGALLHDIGKMGIPDSILLKSGALTEEEWEVMRKHPVYAYELLAPISHLRAALDVPFCHHEKWDGTGYPRGLKGDHIPLAARIFAVVDVYDALCSDRPYRPAWSAEKAREYIREQKGKHFDPLVVDRFLQMPTP